MCRPKIYIFNIQEAAARERGRERLERGDERAESLYTFAHVVTARQSSSKLVRIRQTSQHFDEL